MPENGVEQDINCHSLSNRATSSAPQFGKQMNAWKIATFACGILAVIAVGFGAMLTIGLIKEYRETVNALRLAGQAALLWIPPAGVFTAVGYLCWLRAGK